MEWRCKGVSFYRKTINGFLHYSIIQSYIKSIVPTLQRTERFFLWFLSHTQTECRPEFSDKRATFCISRKGSLTVEAAVVLPVFLFAVLTLLNLMEVCRMQGMLSVSLQNSAETLGTYGYVLPEEEDGAELLLGTGACMLYAQNQLPEEAEASGNISLWKSRYENHMVKLQAEYKGKVGYLFFLPEVTVTCRGCVRAWVGDTVQERETGGGEEMVFVTEYGEVFHTSSSCRHLSVSISAVNLSRISSMRNESGERYHACEKCVGTGAAGELLYVTDTGNRYHNSLECGGLKRSVRLVKKSEVSGCPACSSCQAAEGK